MKTTEKHNGVPVHDLRGLILRPEARLGTFRPTPHKEPVFHRALMMVFLYGAISAFMMYLYREGHLDLRVKNLYAMLCFPLFLMPAMKINGDLTPGRVVLILLNMAAFAVWNFVFQGNDAMHALLFPVGMIALCYWFLFQPDILERLGIRRKHFLKDLVVAVAFAAIVNSYVYFLLKFWGFGNLEINLLPTISYALTVFTESMMNVCLYFTVWSFLKKKGMNVIDSIGIMSLLLIAFMLPFVPVHYLTGNHGLTVVFAAFCAFSLFCILCIIFTFSQYKNVLPVSFMMCLLFALLRMAGLL